MINIKKPDDEPIKVLVDWSRKMIWVEVELIGFLFSDSYFLFLKTGK